MASFNKPIFRLAITGIRFFLGLIFFTAGMAKLTQNFPGIIGPVWLEERLEVYHLGVYAKFIAWSQVVIGLLLLTQRFATLGAIMLFPMISNILMVTISLEWKGTPYVNAFLLLLNLILLLWDYNKLKILFLEKTDQLESVKVKRSAFQDLMWTFAMILVLISVPFVRDHMPLGYLLVGLGLLTFILCQFWPKLQPNVRSKVKEG